jgi:hypothetical protein
MRVLTGFVALVVITGCAVAADKPPAAPAPQPQPAQAAPPPAAPAAGAPLTNDSTVDQILDALDAVGRNLKSFTADVTMREEDVTLANESTRRGKVLFQTRPDDKGTPGGGTRLRVIFEKRETAKRSFDERVEYLLQDGWLTDRTYDPKRIEVRRQVLRPGEKINLLKLGEGPFPLPIGQKKEAVHEQFDVKKPAAGKDDPPGTVHVQLAPKPGTRFAKKFDAIDVFVDAKTHLPVRIDTAQGETVRTTELKNFTINPTPPLTDADFALPQIDKSKWSLHDEPFSE